MSPEACEMERNGLSGHYNTSAEAEQTRQPFRMAVERGFLPLHQRLRIGRVHGTNRDQTGLRA